MRRVRAGKPSRQIDEDDLAFLQRLDIDLSLVADGDAVAGLGLDVVHGDAAVRGHEIGAPPWLQAMVRVGSLSQRGAKKGRILMDGQRVAIRILGAAGSEHHEAAAAVLSAYAATDAKDLAFLLAQTPPSVQKAVLERLGRRGDPALATLTDALHSLGL